MFDSVGKPVFIVGFCDDIHFLLNRERCVAHGNRSSCYFKLGKVIATVSKGKDFIELEIRYLLVAF